MNVGQHYAILVGINAYVERPLLGCVEDVLEMRKYLNSLPFPFKTYLFTLMSSNATSSGHIIEHSDQWPTYEKVKSSLREIANHANSGDSVLIHYSGHGTRMRASRDPTSTYAGDVALTLVNGLKGDKIAYLRGLDLAHSIKGLVDKGVKVTLILDCCFSGGVSRHDGPETDNLSTTRFLDCDVGNDSVCSIDPENIFNDDVEPQTSSPREASMLPNWLINPDGYSIFAACGPHEKARERRFDGGPMRGVLSYFLLRCLRELGWGSTQQVI